MTLDELNVKVSVAADEALEKLDELIDRARTLGALCGADGLGQALAGTGAAAAGRELGDMSAEAARADKAVAALSASAREMQRRFADVSGLRKSIQEFRDLRAEYQRAAAGGGDTAAAFEAMRAAAKALGLDMDRSEKSMDGCLTAVDALEKGMALDANSMIASLGAMLQQARQTESGLNIRAAMGVDVSQPLSAIQAVIAVIAALLALMGQAGIKAKGGSRSGGGGGSSRATGAAPVSAARTESAYEKAMDELNHLIALDRLSYEQQLAHLEAIGRKYRLSAQERRQLEEDMYDVQKAMRERDAETLDTVADALQTALEKRWEAARDAELGRLDQSREAWEKWRDQSVAAVEAQIAALDDLADAEDREAKDAEELRKLEKLRQDMEYEQDAYSRQKLARQLELAIESREERLRKQERQDRKDALRAQIDEIDARADAETAAIAKAREEVEAAYAERLKAASLAAEAEKTLAESTQREIVELIRAFAPEYDLAGQTLGQRLLDGFRAKVGDVAGWFAGLAAQAESWGAAPPVGAAAARGAQAGYAAGGVTITQHNTFNQPVETPCETARRVRLANEALAEELLREK